MSGQEHASVEVSVPVEVTVKITAEHTSEAELRAHIARNARQVATAVEHTLGSRKLGAGAGWIDDDREAYVEDIIHIDAVAEAKVVPCPVCDERAQICTNPEQPGPLEIWRPCPRGCASRQFDTDCEIARMEATA